MDALTTLRDAPERFGQLRTYVGTIAIERLHQDAVRLARRMYQIRFRDADPQDLAPPGPLTFRQAPPET